MGKNGVKITEYVKYQNIYNLYFSIQMQKNLQLLFDPIQKHDLQSLQQIPCSLQSELLLVQEEGSQDSRTLILENKKFYLKTICLQLRQPFIVQFDSQKQSFKSAIKNSLNLKLQIFKQLSLIQSEYSTNWFRLILTNEIRKSMAFTARKEQNIQEFIQRTKRIPLLQHGFDKYNHYEPIRKIGKGALANVYESFDLILNKKVAVRCFRLNKVQKNGKFKDSLIEEINLLHLISSTVQNASFFSKLQAIYESQNSLYMIMQLLTRNLKAHITKFNFPSFPNCKKLMYNLAKAINMLHKIGIMHRDIKLQNIMLRQDSPLTTTPVIIDFGIARKGIAPADSLPCGTPGYIAPQIFSGYQYSNKCDVFSLGVVYHYLLLGQLIFEGSTAKAISAQNQKCNIDYEFSRHPVITPEIRSLLSSMLRKQPEKPNMLARSGRPCVFLRMLNDKLNKFFTVLNYEVTIYNNRNLKQS